MVGTLDRCYRCATSWYDLDLTFDLSVVTLTYKSLYLVGTLVGDCRCAVSWCDLGLTSDLAIATFTVNILSGQYLKL